MVESNNEERAVKLAREAVELLDAGHKEAASRNLREALSLAPENSEVQAAFLKIRAEEQSGHPLLDLCRRYASEKNEEAGKEAARFLRADGFKAPEDVALESLKLILAEKADALSATQDEIISGLVRQNASVRQFFASQLQVSVTTFFDQIYVRGDGAAVCLDTVVLDPTLWPSEDVRSYCESELFQLFIAKLMESGHDLDGRSLKGITRLLAVDAEKLQHLVDDEGFDVIISSLDNRLPLDVRSQATLATAKYLEASKEVGQKRFSKLVTAKVTKARNEDLIVAFSAVAAVFPVVPTITATLFLAEGFLQSIEPLLDREVKSTKVEVALLELFNAACMDKACREAIRNSCTEWLTHILSNGTEKSSELAAVVLAKVKASETGDASESNGKVQEESNSVHELVDRFKGLMSGSKVARLHNPVEGLAYSSVKPDVKEQLAHDPAFLKGLFSVLVSHVEDSSLLYGGLMLISNLTRYLPNLSEEQKKMSELKAYADATKGAAQPNPLDDDEHVMARCNAVIDAGVMPLLVECGKTSLKSVHGLTSKILLSLSKNPKTRGKLAQQGAVKLLLNIVGPKNGSSSAPDLDETTHNASHALARVLISVNPSHVFPYSGFPQITSAIRPLVALLTPPETNAISVEQPRDLLPVFESLLALTNLASSPDVTAAESIVRQAWPVLEDLLLSNNTFIQRAACELVCNLMTCESGILKFADGSKRAGQRLHVLLALTDVEDVATRRAASGALAMLTEYDAAIAAVLERPRGVNLLLSLCQENNDDLVHRGVVCIRNLTCAASGDVGARARDAVRQNRGIDTLKGCLQRSSNPAILQAGVEALKPLVEQTAG
ncbi:hypothetical protein VTN96DRAFT_4897 [Rasamsonia emersonii]|uniref:Actin cytoskeleton organization protein (Cro1) n=1 Tax=Rasamsonia emersonii (strain ATCC 16479 / CBS 393.64 / IMI 116815) TaxID=1408163 RepID=A0A0F4YTN3_RASE3|nr:Actin cytoskeleton organization protein (Cro1) [Rasamsonia emersonii CBS 393.64]KKA21470.1 Actin cytoskeleton organization protein (Cro1) [Rasamsonia emersonii CBS 393.64]